MKQMWIFYAKMVFMIEDDCLFYSVDFPCSYFGIISSVKEETSEV